MSAPARTMFDLPTDDTPVPVAAEVYAGLGFSVVPLHGVIFTRDVATGCTCRLPTCEPRSWGKHPTLDRWQQKATSDVDEVRELFRGHRGNIGIMLGRAFVVLDVDGPEGYKSLETLGELPPTMTSRSGSGIGEHRLFAYAAHHDADEVTNRTFLPKLDAKTRTGQIVVAPSLHRAGHRYRWTTSTSPATLPDSVYEVLRKPKRAPVVVQITQPPTPDLYKRAAAYLAKIPGAVSGSGGHAQTFDVARRLAGFVSKGLSQNEAWSLLADYNRRCDPPWAEHELKHKFADALRAHTIPEIADRPGNVTPIRRPPQEPPNEPPGGDQPPPPPREESWKARLIWEQTQSGKQKIAKHIENAIVVLRYHPAWKDRVRLDEHSRVTTVTDPPWHDSDRPRECTGTKPWTDADSVRLSAWIRRDVGVDISTEACDRAVDVAGASLPYHPIRDYLESLTWDRSRRLPTACAVYLGADQSLFTELVLRWWMIAAVARVYEPGCKADNVLILEGPQGLKKSSALSVLASPPWFSDTPIDLHSKDAYEGLHGKWIVELAELETLRKTDAARAKAFFSSSVDTYRPPYGRRSITAPRACVFAGSVNHASYLQDPTGNRRYWPVLCRRIDLAGLARDRDQLWAEARALYREKAKWWPVTEAELTAAEEAQAPRAEGDEWEGPVAAWLARHPTTEPTVGDLMLDVLNLTRDRWGRSEQMRVASIMQRLGFERRQVREHGARTWRYVRTKAGPNPLVTENV